MDVRQVNRAILSRTAPYSLVEVVRSDGAALRDGEGSPRYMPDVLADEPTVSRSRGLAGPRHADSSALAVFAVLWVVWTLLAVIGAVCVVRALLG